MRLKIANVSTDTANMTRTIWNTRRATNRPIELVLQPDLRSRVERVAYAVTEHVQRQHGDHQHQAGHDRQVRRGGDAVDPLLDHRPPGGARRANAGAEERERRLEEHGVSD